MGGGEGGNCSRGWGVSVAGIAENWHWAQECKLQASLLYFYYVSHV